MGRQVNPNSLAQKIRDRYPKHREGKSCAMIAKEFGTRRAYVNDILVNTPKYPDEVKA